MSRFLIRFLLLSCAVPTAICDAQEVLDPQSAAVSKPIVVTLGDSITKGVRSGVAADEVFAALIEQELNTPAESVSVINVGIGGERTDQALLRLDSVLALNPSVVTVMYGTNDSYVDQGNTSSRISVEAYRENLERLTVELLRRGILPVLMTEPRWADDARPNGVGENPNIRLEPYVQACRETAQKWRVPLVDHYAAWSTARENGVALRDWTTDGCHPNPAGHRELADAIVPVVRQAIASGNSVRSRLQSGEPVRIVCFGDSVTGVYYHTGSRQAYTDMLGVALRRIYPDADLTMINAGISGHTTADALARIDRDVLRHQPDLVTVMFGLNDMTRVSPDDYRRNLRTIVEQCRAAGSEIILATPNNVIDTSSRPTEKLIQYCDIIRETGQELNVPVCDVYRELEAVRSHDTFDWRLLMSDEIHPNMDGHKRVATAIAQTISGNRIPLDDVPPAAPLQHTIERLKMNQPIRVLAMPPFDGFVEAGLKQIHPSAAVTVERWETDGRSLSDVEQDAKARVRAARPDLVLIALPRAATATLDSDAAFARSFAWVMNWSLNFGQPTWDVVVIHPSVRFPATKDPATADPRGDLIRRLVKAQNLSLIDASEGDVADAEDTLKNWLKRHAVAD
ncbi:MAG: hypothetical protein KDA96_25185 [Planctomycetaceae bacterium]|nr:hypothetical protein [Planctomycetaceae bacterium]